MHFILILIQLCFLGGELRAASTNVLPKFPSCDPESELVGIVGPDNLSPQFCAQWNPDFPYNGNVCCSVYHRSRRKRGHGKGPNSKRIGNNCSSITTEQKIYIEAMTNKRLGDSLQFLTREIGRNGEQAFCGVNNGFLAHGRPILPTPENHLAVIAPHRCSNFGTDAMAAMLDWLGRDIARNFSAKETAGSVLSIGDVAGPKGGPLFGTSGRRGHASHTNGEDADVGFLNTHSDLVAPVHFERTFIPKLNWWFLKEVFKNPYACIKVIFVDRRMIQALGKYAKKDRDWKHYSRFIRHMPGHKTHFHIRIGNGPGQPGCTPGARPELEDGDNDETSEFDESSLLEDLEELKSRKGAGIQQ